MFNFPYFPLIGFTEFKKSISYFIYQSNSRPCSMEFGVLEYFDNEYTPIDKLTKSCTLYSEHLVETNFYKLFDIKAAVATPFVSKVKLATKICNTNKDFVLVYNESEKDSENYAASFLAQEKMYGPVVYIPTTLFSILL